LKMTFELDRIDLGIGVNYFGRGELCGAYARKAIGSPDAIMISAAVKVVVAVARLM